MRFAVFILGALPLMAANSDVTGKWNLEGDVAGNPVNLKCTMQQAADSKVTGDSTLTSGDTVPIAGTVKNAKVKFSFNAGGYTLEYTGTIEGDAMSGDIEVAGTTGSFSGKRASN